jgi:hypothetical protein
MGLEIQARPYSSGERVVLLVTRVLTTTLLTAVVGAIENWFFERFFAPNLYAAGPPLGRAAWVIAWSSPFILAGLVILGLPTAYLLHRARVENALSYGIAGLLTGTLWGYVIVYDFGLSGFYGCVCALFWWLLRPRG